MSTKGTCIYSDYDAALQFRDIYDGRLVYCNKTWYIRPLGEFYWIRGKHAVKNCIGKLSFTKNGKPYGSNIWGINNIFAMLVNQSEYVCNNQFLYSNDPSLDHVK